MADLEPDEIAALQIALNDKHNKPGLVGAQTTFHGKPNPTGREAHAMLVSLKNRGLLQHHHSVGPESIDERHADPFSSTSHFYTLTDQGRAVAEAHAAKRK